MDGTGQPVASGHREVDESASTFTAIGVGLTLIALIVLLVGLNNLIVSLIAGVFLLAGLALTARSVREMRRWNPIEVRFTQWPLPLGSTQQLLISRVAKAPVPEGPIGVTGTLTCTETVTYRVGTDTRTDRATPATVALTGEAHLANGRIDGTLELTIPVDRGGPTMDLASNEIHWELELELTNPRGADKSMTVRLPVTTELARPLQDIQDAPPEPG